MKYAIGHSAVIVNSKEEVISFLSRIASVSEKQAAMLDSLIVGPMIRINGVPVMAIA